MFHLTILPMIEKKENHKILEDTQGKSKCEINQTRATNTLKPNLKRLIT